MSGAANAGVTNERRKKALRKIATHSLITASLTIGLKFKTPINKNPTRILTKHWANANTHRTDNVSSSE
jgi:hypothetical protein